MVLSWHCDFTSSLIAQSKRRAIGFLFLEKSLHRCFIDGFGPNFIGRATVWNAEGKTIFFRRRNRNAPSLQPRR